MCERNLSMIFQRKESNDSVFWFLGCIFIIALVILGGWGLWALFLEVVEVIARTIKNA